MPASVSTPRSFSIFSGCSTEYPVISSLTVSPSLLCCLHRRKYRFANSFLLTSAGRPIASRVAATSASLTTSFFTSSFSASLTSPPAP